MDVTNLRALLRLLRPYPWIGPTLVVTGVLASLAEGLSIGMLIPFVGVLLGDAPLSVSGSPVVKILQAYSDLMPAESRAAFLGVSMVVLITAKSLLLSVRTALSLWVSGKVCHTTRLLFFRQLFDVGYAFVARTDRGTFLATLKSAVAHIGDAVTIVFNTLIHLCTVVVFTVLLFLISWQLTLGVTVCVALAFLAAGSLRQHARRMSDLKLGANKALAGRFVDVLDGMRVIRAFGQEAREEARLGEASERLRAATYRIDLLTGLVTPLLEVLYVPLFVGTLFIAWHMGIGLPALMAYLILLYRMQPPLRAMDHDRVSLAGLTALVEEVFRLLDSRDKPYIRSGTVPFEHLTEEVAFSRVTFSYQPETGTRAAVADCSFEIIRGEVTAIVGGSGAGKSTLINLLCRFYDPEGGEILVDGRSLPSLVLSDWRRRLAIAGQDADLLSGTVLENISYGAPDAPRDAVMRAASQADAHDFIEALPYGYDTMVGDRGAQLSGGQRQRIGLARALLRDPDILVLDEATNAVDSLSESAIQRVLGQLRGRMTLIVIAHRWSTIHDADRVVVMHEGRVVETGRPEVLLEANSSFARLYGQPRSGLLP